MDINKIKLAVEMTMEITAKSYALIPVVARKMKVSEIDLMLFVKENDKLFHTEVIWSYKDKKVKHRLFPSDPKSTYYTTEKVKSKNLGLGIRKVYKTPDENFRTDEWLEKQIKEQEKFLYIKEADNYGYIQGYYVEVDPKDDTYKTGYWRNTLEKVNKLKEEGYLTPGSFVYGGLGDSYTSEVSTTITMESIEKLKKKGWIFNNFRPLSKN